MSDSDEQRALTSDGATRRRRWGCIGVVLGALALAVWAVPLCAPLLNPFPTALRDPGDYAGVVRDRKSWAPERYAFLPDEIDPSAESVGFYHSPGFVRGGDVVCLRLGLPPERVAEIAQGLEAAGRRELSRFHEFASPRCYPAYADHAARDAGPEDPGPLPDGFRIYDVGATPEQISANWNHNFRAFVAVSVERSEVVWYADGW